MLTGALIWAVRWSAATIARWGTDGRWLGGGVCVCWSSVRVKGCLGVRKIELRGARVPFIGG